MILKYFVVSIAWLCSASCVVASESSKADVPVGNQKVLDQSLLNKRLIELFGEIRQISQDCPVLYADSVEFSSNPEELRTEADQVNKLRSRLKKYVITLDKLSDIHELKQQTEASKKSPEQSKL